VWGWGESNAILCHSVFIENGIFQNDTPLWPSDYSVNTSAEFYGMVSGKEIADSYRSVHY
jgi:hypothetical protein